MKVYKACPTTSPFQDLSLTLGKSGWVGKSHEDVIPFDDKSSHWTLNIVKQLSFGKQDTENKGIPATTFRKKAGRIYSSCTFIQKVKGESESKRTFFLLSS